MTAETPPPQVDDHRPPFWKAFLIGLKTSWVTYTTFVLLVVAVSALLVAITGITKANEAVVQLRRLVECQNRYNETNNERTRQLAAAAEFENAAETKADQKLLRVSTLIDQRATPTEMSKAISDLKVALRDQEDAREATSEERRKHPVPPPPQALCGTVGDALD
jgi:hypothetical protein